MKKPIVSYPAITSAESKLGEGGLVYRDGIETPFTGRIIDRFENGDIQMDSSYLEGQPHGVQVRYYKNGKPALRLLSTMVGSPVLKVDGGKVV